MNFITKLFSIIIFLTVCQFGQSVAMDNSLDKIVVIQMQSFLKYAHNKMTSVESEKVEAKDFIDILKRDLGNLIVASFNTPEIVFNVEFNEDVDRSVIKKAIKLFMLSQEEVLNSNTPDNNVYPQQIKLNEMVAEIAKALCHDLEKYYAACSKKSLYILVGINSKNHIKSANTFTL